jgi:hypothetical protein
LVWRYPFEKSRCFGMSVKWVLIFWLLLHFCFQAVNDVIPPYIPATFSTFAFLFDFEELVHGIPSGYTLASAKKRKGRAAAAGPWEISICPLGSFGAKSCDARSLV